MRAKSDGFKSKSLHKDDAAVPSVDAVAAVDVDLSRPIDRDEVFAVSVVLSRDDSAAM